MAEIDYVQLEFKALYLELVGMTPEEGYAYTLLLLYMYDHDAKCVNREANIKQACGNPYKFKKIWEVIKRKFQVEGEYITQKRVAAELFEAKRRIKARQKAAQARWCNADEMKEQCNSNADATDLHCSVNGNGNINNINTPPISPSKTTAISFNFESGRFEGIENDKKSQWAVAFPAVDIDLELKRAALWVVDNPSKRKSNWGRFLTNWFRRTQERGGNRSNGNFNRTTQTDRGQCPPAGRSGPSNSGKTYQRNFAEQKSNVGETVHV